MRWKDVLDIIETGNARQARGPRLIPRDWFARGLHLALTPAWEDPQLSANRALPWVVPEKRPDVLLHEAGAGKASHARPPTVWTSYGGSTRAVQGKLASQYQQPFIAWYSTLLAHEGLQRGRSPARLQTSVQFRRSEISYPCNRLSPHFASSAIACARVGDAFSDSGRSRRTPSFVAYSLNAMSTSYRISTWSHRKPIG